jgi:hypothetical protein
MSFRCPTVHGSMDRKIRVARCGQPSSFSFAFLFILCSLVRYLHPRYCDPLRLHRKKNFSSFLRLRDFDKHKLLQFKSISRVQGLLLGAGRADKGCEENAVEMASPRRSREKICFAGDLSRGGERRKTFHLHNFHESLSFTVRQSPFEKIRTRRLFNNSRSRKRASSLGSSSP